MGKKTDATRARDNEITKVATEIIFAKLLAGNSKKLRDRGIERLRKWVKARSQTCNYFKQDDLMTIWKGLFYCMWMSDKPIVQEELAETISKLIHNFAHFDGGILFVRCFFLTMQTEWFGIDHLRLDKFLMLGRRFLRQAFQYCHHWKWKTEVTSGLGGALSSTILMPESTGPAPLGFTLHITEVFMEELAKVGRGQLPPEVTTEFVRPFVQYLGKVKDGRSKSQVMHHVFQHLMKQSELGQEFSEKFAAWQQAGFPGTSWRDMEKVKDSDGEEDLSSEDEALAEMVESPQDPRAGRVDVCLPRIDFDAAEISKLLQMERRNTFLLTNRQTLHGLAHQFAQMARGHYPLATGTKLKVMLSKMSRQKGRVRKAASRLRNFDTRLHLEEKEQGVSKLTRKQKTRMKRKLKRMANAVETEEHQGEDRVKKTEKKKKLGGDRSKKGLLEANLNAGETNGKVAGKKNRTLKRKCPILREEISVEAEDVPKSLEYSPALTLRKKKAKGESSNASPALNATQKVNKEKNVTASNMTQPTGTSPPKVRRVTPTKIGPVSWKQNVEVEFEVSPGVFMKRKGLETPVLVDPPKKSRLIGVETPLSGKRNVIKGKARRSSGVWEIETCTPPTVMKNGQSSPTGVSIRTPTSSKRVNIVLMKNKAQAESEYLEAVKQSPGIPFDVKSKPIQGILKPSPISSPINPFYDRTLKRLSKIKL